MKKVFMSVIVAMLTISASSIAGNSSDMNGDENDIFYATNKYAYLKEAIYDDNGFLVPSDKIQKPKVTVHHKMPTGVPVDSTTQAEYKHTYYYADLAKNECDSYTDGFMVLRGSFYTEQECISKIYQSWSDSVELQKTAEKIIQQERDKAAASIKEENTKRKHYQDLISKGNYYFIYDNSIINGDNFDVTMLDEKNLCSFYTYEDQAPQAEIYKTQSSCTKATKNKITHFQLLNNIEDYARDGVLVAVAIIGLILLWKLFLYALGQLITTVTKSIYHGRSKY